MNVNPPFALKEEYGQRRKRSRNSGHLRSCGFGLMGTRAWEIPFHQVLGTHYNPKHECLLIQFALGTIVIMGPKRGILATNFATVRLAPSRRICSRALGVVDHLALVVSDAVAGLGYLLSLSFAVRHRNPLSV
jgi:hypothetical protein